MAAVSNAPTARVSRWLFEPQPRARVAVFRTIVYAFIFVDVLLTTSWVDDHAIVPGELYQPLFIGRILPLPTPGPLLVPVLEIALLLCAAAALTGRWPRLAGGLVAVLYTEWMFIAMSYGKVDHDRFAFLVALAVLPTVGRARWSDRESDQASGWALRCVQIAVVLTYFLATWAKLRFGGPEWVNGATLMRAVLRRGTFLTDPLQQNAWVLHIAQYAIVLFELFSPLMLLRNRIGRLYVAMAFVFHAVTFATITIIFLPHVVCLLTFLPLERASELRERAARLVGRRRPALGSSP